MAPRVDASPGMHRFAWDFQYATMAGEPSSFALEGGPLAPPGRYTVRLSAGGKSWSQAFAVRKDPRVSASDADLVAQFRVAREIEALRVTTQTSYAMALKRRKLAVAGGPQAQSPENSVGSPATEFTTLWAVAGALESLQAEVESADTAPTADELTALAHWRAVLAADRARL